MQALGKMVILGLVKTLVSMRGAEAIRAQLGAHRSALCPTARADISETSRSPFGTELLLEA